MHTKKQSPTPYWRKGRSLHFSIGLVLSLTLVTTAFEWNFRKEITDIPIELKDMAPPVWEVDVVDVPEMPRPKVPVKPIPIPDPTIESTATAETVEPVIELPEPTTDVDLGNLFNGDAPVDIEPDEAIYDLIPAVPEGGMDSFYKYLHRNISYPEHLKHRNMSGTVTVAFEIDKEGRIARVKIIKGFDEALEKEIIRVLKNAPAWVPAQRGNQKVSMVHQIPFSFDLR